MAKQRGAKQMKAPVLNRRNMATQFGRYFLILVLISIVGLACQDESNTASDVSSGNGMFEIYLVQDWMNSAVSAGGVTGLYNRLEELSETEDIGNMVIADEPLITEADIVFYDWDDHTIKLTAEATNRLIQTGYGNGMQVPFIVVAKGERIYFGAFWPGQSSYMPMFPSIWYLPTIFPCSLPSSDNMGCTLQLQGSETILSDQRVYDALKQANLLMK